MKTYIVYDGRAAFDTDSASILEYVGEATEGQAKENFVQDWSDTDACLFAYDSEGENLVNGQQVFI